MKLFSLILTGLAALLISISSSSKAHAQCDFTTKIAFSSNFTDISDISKMWTRGSGLKFVVRDQAGRLIGRAPLPSPSPAVRPDFFPIHTYGDDGTTAAVEGPAIGDTLYIYSNLLVGCGKMKTTAPVLFGNQWNNTLVELIHPGDISGDRSVDSLDFFLVSTGVILQSRFGIYDCKCDVNADNRVDALDQGLVGRIVLYKDLKSTLGKWAYACKSL